ncbi:hypothetical protein ARMGADRAFT_1038251 [Armillaria gallica]|uniref:Uncharacterized protein n=1 Tax=Armillaria gallica TaxID=47427 RepID=A0A2H3CNK1_ARMGA|nr:hypothetical protein ARMGADRAFT_1038251 [Armillaria gallica]
MNARAHHTSASLERQMLLIGTSEKSTKAKGWGLFFCLVLGSPRTYLRLSNIRGAGPAAFLCAGDGQCLMEDGNVLKCCLKADVVITHDPASSIFSSGYLLLIKKRENNFRGQELRRSRAQSLAPINIYSDGLRFLCSETTSFFRCFHKINSFSPILGLEPHLRWLTLNPDPGVFFARAVLNFEAGATTVIPESLFITLGIGIATYVILDPSSRTDYSSYKVANVNHVIEFNPNCLVLKGQRYVVNSSDDILACFGSSFANGLWMMLAVCVEFRYISGAKEKGQLFSPHKYDMNIEIESGGHFSTTLNSLIT